MYVPRTTRTAPTADAAGSRAATKPGGTGYVALYEIVSPSKVVVLAVPHQREEGYH